MANFTLTANDDTLVGTSGKDSFGAASVANNRGWDDLTGGAGLDSLSVNYSTITTDYDSYYSNIHSDGAGGFYGNISGGLIGTSAFGYTTFSGFESLTIRLSGLDDYLNLEAASLGSGATVNIGGGAGIDTLAADFSALSSTTFTVAANGTITSNRGTYSGFEVFHLYIGAGTNTVQTGGGNDSVYGYAGGTNSIKTGAGNDYIYSVDSVDTIDGGAGDDTWAADKGTGTNDLTFTVTGTGATISDGSSAANVERFIFYAGAGNDIFQIVGNPYVSTYGGLGDDTLSLNLAGTNVYNSYYEINSNGAGGFTGQMSGYNSYFSSIEHIVLIASDDDSYVWVDATPLADGATLNLSGGLGNDTLAIDFRNIGSTSFTVAADGTITSSQGTYTSFEAFTVSVGAGTNTVQTQDGNDGVNAYAGGTNSIKTGAGNDYIYSYDSVDTIDGGADSDTWIADRGASTSDLTLTVSGTEATISDGSSATNVETVSLYGGSGNDTFNISGNATGDFRGRDGEDTLNLDMTGITVPPYYYSNTVNSDGFGAFAGSSYYGNQSFSSIEHLNITFDDGDNYILINASPLAGGATLNLSGGAGYDTLQIDFTNNGSTSFKVAADGTITSNNGTYASFDDFRISLGAGTSTVQTQSGSDYINAYDGGTNSIKTGAGVDYVTSYLSVDTIDGGEDNDRWTADKSTGTNDLTFTVSGTSATISDGSSAINVEAFNLYGGFGNDIFNVSGNTTGDFRGSDGEDTLNLDLGGTSTPYYYYNTSISNGGTGAFSGYVNGGSQYFYSIEHLNITLDDSDNSIVVDASQSRNGATLLLDGGVGSDTVRVYGTFAGWSITEDGFGGTVLNDIDASDGDYGSFTVKNMETAQFDDQTYDLTITHTGQHLIGDDGDNTLTGTVYDDVIEGRGGNDTLTGGAGTDTLSYESAQSGVKVLMYQVGASQPTEGAGDDTLGDKFENLIGSEYRDRLWGNDLDNHISGLGGNDYINGMEGADTLAGGAGNDFYAVDNAGDAIVENSGDGYDAVSSVISYMLADNVERLQLAGPAADLTGTGNDLDNLMSANDFGSTLNGGFGDDWLIGGAAGDTLNGEIGNDRLDGRGGADALSGGLGDDTYTIDGADTLTENEGEGTDTVLAGFSYTLDTNFEKLTLTGSGDFAGTGNAADNTVIGNGGNNLLHGLDGADRLYGNAGADTLEGGNGNDYLNGGLGADAMTGGAGNDLYYVDSAGDGVTESAGGGTDTVSATINYTLDINVEKLVLTGSGNLKGTGSAAGNTIQGNAGNNVLTGLAGGDTLTGAEGNDRLSGGAGRDTLIGGAGADAFRFDVLETTANRDTIADFVHGTDKIELSISVFTALLGNPVSLAFGTAAATSADHLIYNQATGVLSYDADGSGSGAAVQIALLSTKPVLDAADFLLVA